MDHNNVAVLDKTALYIFNKEGELIKKIMEKNAGQLRGLAYNKVKI